MKRKNILPAIIISSLLCTTATLNGCALLPSEDARCILPTIAAQDIPNYEMVSVIRTDLVKTATATATYNGGTERINLSFNTDGLDYKAIYVAKGTKVTKGQLLAELDTGDLDERIKKLEQDISDHKIYLSHQTELKQLDTARIDVQYEIGDITAAERDAAINALAQKYTELNYLEETLRYEEIQYASLCAQQANALIYSPVDGMVSSVAKKLTELNNVSTKGEEIITVIEYSDFGFKGYTGYRNCLTNGDTITITLTDGREYDTVIEFSPTDSEEFYLYTIDDSVIFDYGEKVKITFPVENRENVIAVDNNAIQVSKETKFVYCLNEDGYRDVKLVTTGLKGDNGYIEILSGLEPGDIVIK